MHELNVVYLSRNEEKLKLGALIHPILMGKVFCSFEQKASAKHGKQRVFPSITEKNNFSGKKLLQAPSHRAFLPLSAQTRWQSNHENNNHR